MTILQAVTFEPFRGAGFQPAGLLFSAFPEPLVILTRSASEEFSHVSLAGASGWY